MASVLLCVVACSPHAAVHPNAIRLDMVSVQLVNEEPHPVISGLRPHEAVTVSADTRDAHGAAWHSAAQFIADDRGNVALDSASPTSGSYTSADGGGLLWSLKPVDGPTNQAVAFPSVAQGFSVDYKVLVNGSVMAEQSVQRVHPHPTARAEMATDGVQGTLYGNGGNWGTNLENDPAVVVIGGSEGGEQGLTAAALSGLGFPSFALAYFGEAGLPYCLCNIPLEYFQKAVAWMRTQLHEPNRPVVLVGASRGGEAALLIGSYLPSLFTSIVAISPADTVRGSYGANGRFSATAWTFRGKPLATGVDIPVNRMRAGLLMSAGDQDGIWDSVDSVNAVAKTLDAMRDPPPHQIAIYSGVGHAVAGGVPYFPAEFYQPIQEWGGTAQLNAQACEQFWLRMVSFIQDRP